MSNTQLAYELGYRVTKDGNVLYENKPYRIFVQHKDSGRNLLYFRIKKTDRQVYLSKLQAYQKFGEIALKENCIYIDGNTLNCSADNITIRPVFKKELEKLNKYYCTTCNRLLSPNCFFKCNITEKECPYRLQQCKECRNKVINSKKEFILHNKKDGCVICGEKDPTCLDFHHLDNKHEQVSHMNCYSMNKIQQEIDKCVVLCANCHRKLHGHKLTLEQLKLLHDHD